MSKSKRKPRGRLLIAKYHTLLKEKEKLKKKGRGELTHEIEQQLEDLGGLDHYQKLSQRGAQRGSDSSKWVLKQIKQKQLIPPDLTQVPLKLLDVGALQDYYSKHPEFSSKQIALEAIDLNPQDQKVKKADFFEFANSLGSFQYDFLVLSLVLNFVPLPEERGEMLRLAASILKRSSGILFIVLPLACVENSRYMKHSRFVKLVQSCGFVLVEQDHSNKLARYVFRRMSIEQEASHPKIDYRRKTCRYGKGNFNNFCITTKGSS
jgi:25S rRNA (adenine2142-N1)-methyltransferase